jgi:hypothetical protein
MRRPSRFFAIAVLAVYAVSAAGCMQWTPTPIAPLPDPMPHDVRVTLDDGRQVRMANPRVEQEMIVADDSVSVPLPLVRQVEVQTVNGGAVARVVLGLAVLGGLIAMLAQIDCCNFDFGDWGDLGY